MLPERYYIHTKSEKQAKEVADFLNLKKTDNKYTGKTDEFYYPSNKEFLGYRNISFLKSYLIIEFEDWKKEQFPEKWAIKATESTYKEIVEWFTKAIKRTPSSSDRSWFHYPEIRIRECCTSGRKEENYTEITFEQFKQITMQEKEIIGYKTKEGVNIGAARRALDTAILPLMQEKINFKTGSILHDRAKQLGILDLLFEPVYGVDKKTIHIGTPKIPVEIEGDKITVDKFSVTTTKADLERYIDRFKVKLAPATNVFGDYEIRIVNPVFHIGCGDGPNISLEELESLLK